MFGWMRKHDRLELCLVLPDGSKSLIPASWTDVDIGPEASSGPETLGSLDDLLHARAVVDALIHRAATQRAEDAQEPTEEVPMQPPLPLAGLIAPPPLAWEHLAPGEQLEAVAVLARLIAQLVQPTPEEGETDD